MNWPVTCHITRRLVTEHVSLAHPFVDRICPYGSVASVDHDVITSHVPYKPYLFVVISTGKTTRNEISVYLCYCFHIGHGL